MKFSELQIISHEAILSRFCQSRIGVSPDQVSKNPGHFGALGEPSEVFENYIHSNEPVFRSCLSIKNASFKGGVWNIFNHEQNYRIDFPLLDYSFRGYRDAYSNGYDEKITDNYNYIGGNSLLLNGTWANEYYHFVNETIPKWLLATLVFPEVYFDTIIIGEQNKPYIKQWFQLLGIKFGSILYAKANRQYKCENLYVPFLPSDPGRTSNFYTDFLRQKLVSLNPITSGLPKKLFLNRSTKRKLTNSTELYTKLKPLGFVELYLEDFSVIQQLNLMRQAEFIVAPHGAALVNTLNFTGCLVELVGKNYQNPCYYDISLVLGNDYYYYQCDDNFGDLNINTDEFVKSISKINLK